jgi:hypothetical protein
MEGKRQRGQTYVKEQRGICKRGERRRRGRGRGREEEG